MMITDPTASICPV